MKRMLAILAASLSLLLAGCATAVRSDVTTFHQWPAQIEDKSYAMEAPSPQDDTLEWRSYADLVRGQLDRLGFHDVGAGKANLLVSMRFMTTDVPVRVIQAADPFFTGAPYSPRMGWYGPRYRRYWYSPYYDPFWNPYVFEERIVHTYQRELQVGIRKVGDGQRLFDVTVRNHSRQAATPAIMPALVQSAFTGFPGQSGSARTVELKLEP